MDNRETVLAVAELIGIDYLLKVVVEFFPASPPLQDVAVDLVGLVAAWVPIDSGLAAYVFVDFNSWSH